MEFLTAGFNRAGQPFCRVHSHVVGLHAIVPICEITYARLLFEVRASNILPTTVVRNHNTHRESNDLTYNRYN